MKRYKGYKDSETEWFGEIPESWSRMSFRFGIGVLTDYTANGSFASLAENVNYLESGFSRLVRLTDLREGLTNEGIYVDEKAHGFLKKSELFGGELLLANVGAYAGYITIMPAFEQKMTLGPNMFLIRPHESYDTKFLYYLLSSTNCAEQLRLLAISSAQPKLNKENVRQVQILSPPLSEQKQITRYLDHKTSKIEKLITDKEKLIELLNEERTAIINQAVTKGLNPNVPMKDSGIEWLGEVPQHWEVKKLRYLGECQNGVSAGAEYFGSGYPFVSYSDVYHNVVLPKVVKGLALSTDIDRHRYSVLENDVFFTRTSETIDEIGLSATCIDTIENAVFAGFLTRFRPNSSRIFKGFSKYYFRCFMPRVFFVKEMNLVTRASLSQELLKRLPVVLPPLDEQTAIYRFLEEKDNNIIIAIAKTRQEIQLLKEYKTALISEVVTGKVDVRDEIIAESPEPVT